MNTRYYTHWTSETHMIDTTITRCEEEKEWCEIEHPKRDYQSELDDIPTEEIERYLRRKKLERIKKNDG